MSEEEFKDFKNRPEDSIEKRIYDSLFMNIEEYLTKYFSKEDELKKFNSFYKEYVCPVLEKDKRDLYLEFLKKRTPPFFVNYEKFDEFNNTQELRNKYSDIELFNFLSFLYSVFNQFDNIKEFLNWLNNKEYFQNLNFDEILKYPFGNNYMKSNLVMLPILNSSWLS